MKEVVDSLLKWYQENKRELPWRKDKDPYHVWISEVMLQQTRIEAVLPYYERFMKELPTISDLAFVEEEKLLKLWEGLGYYNRARNLKKAAIMIIEKWNGKFPDRFDEIRSLPGIGEYTASALASICFHHKESCIDGNVLRVYHRLLNRYDNIDDLCVRKKAREELMKLMPEEAGDFNQALMELGEVICIPNGMPKCDICPLACYCQARKNHTFLKIPVRLRKTIKKNQKYTVLLLTHQNKIALHKRVEGVLKNMWEFPLLPGELGSDEVNQYLIDCSTQISSITPSVSYTHIFTHLKWQMKSYRIEVESSFSDYVWVDLHTLLEKYPLPSAMYPFLEVLRKEYGL